MTDNPNLSLNFQERQNDDRLQKFMMWLVLIGGVGLGVLSFLYSEISLAIFAGLCIGWSIRDLLTRYTEFLDSEFTLREMYRRETDSALQEWDWYERTVNREMNQPPHIPSRINRYVN